MKKSTLIIFILILNIGNTQSGIYKNVVRIIVDDSLLIPSVETMSNNLEFQSIINQHDILKIDRPFYFAKSSRLKNCYDFYSDSSVQIFSENLTSFAKNNPGQILCIERLPITKELSVPSDWLWSQTTDTTGMWYLKKIEADKAWDITKGDTSVKIAVIDSNIDTLHPDLKDKIYPPFDFYTGLPFYSNGLASTNMNHGTGIATLIAAETSDYNIPALGQMPSIGYNSRIMFSQRINSPSDIMSIPNYPGSPTQSRPDVLCLYASTVMHAKVINVSFYDFILNDTVYNLHTLYAINSNFNSSLLVEKEILNNGTSIVRAAGNNDGNVRHYPFSGFEDERIIVVSGTDYNDKHSIIYNGAPYSHSHYPEVDLCAPSYSILAGASTSNNWPYNTYGGTSQSTPLVVGTIGLMYSVNPCLTPSWVQDILKNTTDPIVDAADYPGLVGTGRLNAYKAVLAAQQGHSTNLDLFIKDRPEDLGNQQFPYHWQAARDESPDIWVRNQPDGLTNQVHQEPEFNSSSPVYV